MNFRSKFVEISDHVSKLKLYHIANSIGDHMNKFSFDYFVW